MDAVAEMMGEARGLLRDFPVFFENEQGPLNTLTIRLEHPYISRALQVFVTDVADPENPVVTETTEWSLDERNGILKLTNEAHLGLRFLAVGYYFKWFTDEDLERYVTDIVTEFTFDRPANDANSLSDVEKEVATLGVVVRALWSLLIELALDIDVSTPEGMFIPAHQRYQQVLGMMQHWENVYNERAASLNVGLGKVEIYRLRRVAKLTNRYVPVYKNRELEDPFWPERIFPPIPDLEVAGPEKKDIIEVTEAYKPGGRFRSGVYPSASWPEMLGRGSWNV